MKRPALLGALFLGILELLVAPPAVTYDVTQSRRSLLPERGYGGRASANYHSRCFQYSGRRLVCSIAMMMIPEGASV